MDINEITETIIGAAIAVHRELGPGLLESIYETCMAHELTQSGWHYERQLEVPVFYKGLRLPSAYRLDLLVEGKVIVEIKSVERLDPIHQAQVLTYLKLFGCHVGLLINFNVPLLKDGLRRLVLGLPESPRPQRLRGE